MQEMWAVSTHQPRNGASHLVLPVGPLSQPEQLLLHCRRVGLAAGTALSPGRSLRGRPLRPAWGKVASVGVGQTSLGGGGGESQGQGWQVVGRNCRAVSEQEGLSPGGWREEALLMDAMHLGAQSRELPFWAGGLVPRKPILGSGCLELALTET